jgi:hypothetical protein
MLEQVFLQNRSLKFFGKLSRQAYSYRFRKALNHFLAQNQSPCVPVGPTVLLADGLWFKFKRRPWVLYLSALKPIGDSRAYFLEPLLQEGKESATGWIQTVLAIPLPLRQSIQALVCDDVTGFVRWAQEQGWVVQLCQFHLLQRLRDYSGRQHLPESIRMQRRLLFGNLYTILEQTDPLQVQTATQILKDGLQTLDLPRTLHMILHQFVQRRIDLYTAWRKYPALELPATTSAMESKNRTIREMVGRARCLPSPETLLSWIKAYLRLHPTIVCNKR